MEIQKKQSLRHGVAVPPPFTQGRLMDSSHICGSGATTASGRFFDEPIGSACGMPQGGLSQATSTAGGYDYIPALPIHQVVVIAVVLVSVVRKLRNARRFT